MYNFMFPFVYISFMVKYDPYECRLASTMPISDDQTAQNSKRFVCIII